MKVMVTDLQIRAWRRQGYSLERIASACGLTTSQISRRIRRIWFQDQESRTDPGPDEIKEACELIQLEWSETERQRRQVYRVGRWTPAVVPVCVLERALD
jgi:IS30 family transposase